MNPYDLQLDQMRSIMRHTILLLEAWMHELPYSDVVTRNTLHGYNLPVEREYTVHDSVSEMMAETGCDYITAAIAHNID